ncbi:MAG: hypothetical protein HKM98_04075, partial [Gammaproteobacteria bacterium]|nr:hypothetical protein [Gammaproteobacteria bacterium]
MKLKCRFCASILLSLLVFAPVAATAAKEKVGIFELIHVADGSFEETAAAVESALGTTSLTLHNSHDIEVGNGTQRARIFVLTSPALLSAAAAEPPNAISGQIVRVAVYNHGESDGTLINMANPVAHAMVFYSNSKNFKNIVDAAKDVADSIRDAVREIEGQAVLEQRAPLRTEKHYRKYKG